VEPSGNEVEDLLLEMRLIKRFHPAINLQTEIHQQQASGHEGRNLLFFVADAELREVKVYFFAVRSLQQDTLPLWHVLHQSA
jgi:hypothetical protein